MRKSTVNQLRRYLLVSWVIGSLCLWFAFWYIHGPLAIQDYQVIAFTVFVTGGFMWSMVDFCKFEEQQGQKKRKKTDNVNLRGHR